MPKQTIQITKATAKTKTLPKNSAKKPQSRISKIFKSHKNPILAMIVVLGVVGIGYFGYVYSSANTTDYSRQQQTCRDNYSKPGQQDNRKRCLERVEERKSADKTATATKATTESVKETRCEAGFFLRDGACKQINQVDPAKVQQACEDQNRVYVEKGNRCGDCKQNYFQSSSACARVAKAEPKDVQAACAASKKKYNATANACGQNCVTGYYVSQGTCVAATAAATASVQASCKAAFRNYNPQTNSCGTCNGGYALSADVCTKVTSAQTALAKKNCAQAMLVFNERTNTCSTKCLTGYIKNDANTCVKITAVSAAELPKLCDAQNQRYDAASKTCSDDCQRGYIKTAEARCITPAAMKASCNKELLQFDATTNSCTDNCKKGAVKVNGSCVDRSEVQNIMSARLCKALSRVWTASTESDDGVNGSCAPICIDPTGQYFIGTTDISSYCTSNSSTAALDFKLSPVQCSEAGRLYLRDIKACSSTCLAKYYQKAGNCIKILVDTADDKTNCDGPAVTKRKICSSDDAQPAPAQSSGDNAIVSNFEYDINEKSCKLLGRVWSKDTTPQSQRSDTSKPKPGCSTQLCYAKDDQARKSNESFYCERSVARITKATCGELHRKWLPRVEGCATRPNQKQTKPQLKAEQCTSPYTVYVYHTDDQGRDECITPSAFQSFSGIARQTGKPIGYISTLGPRALCGFRDGMEWNNGSCRKEVVAPTYPPAPVGNNPSAPVADPSPSAGFPTASFCNSLGRVLVNGNCSSSCTISGYVRTGLPQHEVRGYDKCQPQSSAPSPSNGCREGGCGPINTAPTRKFVSCPTLNTYLSRSGKATKQCPIGNTCAGKVASVYPYSASLTVGRTIYSAMVCDFKA